jgi:hypothetical protein
MKPSAIGVFVGAALSFGLPITASAQAVKPRFVLLLDTSSSMVENPFDKATHGDGSLEHPGCDLDANGKYDDSRLFQAKGAIADTIAAFGSAEFALARFKGIDLGQSCNVDSECPLSGTASNNQVKCYKPAGASQGYCVNTANHYRECDSANAGSSCCKVCYTTNTCTGCTGCNGCTRCSNGSDTNDRILFRSTACRGGTTCLYPSCKAGEVLVPFPATGSSNYNAIHRWVDNKEAVPPFPGGINPDPEIRADLGTPLAGSLGSIRGWLLGDAAVGAGAGLLNTDPQKACRQYSVILLTDGVESCPSGTTGDFNAQNAAAELRNAGAKVYVVGFGISSSDRTKLNNIAVAGGTGSAYFPNNRTELTAALASIIAGSLPKAVCDCDSTCDDEAAAFPNKGQPCTVGVGRCKRAGFFGCNSAGDGTWCTTTPVNMCPTAQLQPGTPVPEKCGINTDAGPCLAPTAQDCADDDCDGVIDNGLTCDCAAKPEICNGKDDDCNGLIDDIPSVPCGANVGLCKAGMTKCQPDGAGGARLICEGATGPSPEECNGLDDNCNGIIDDVPARACFPTGFMGCTYDPNTKNYTCKGMCQPGAQICTMGSWTNSACMGAVTPVPEIPCDGRDNNCDGFVDENNPTENDQCYPENTTGCTFANGSWTCTGECKPGRKMCDPTTGGITCVSAVTPAPEICDGKDNDCDGRVDQGFDVGAECDNGVQGPCRKLGKKVCNPVGTGTVCDAGPAVISEEICDGIDNNCNGEIDEGPLPGVGVRCGSQVGECRQGITMCINGRLVCNDVGPMMEICDGKDNDCDGSVDNNLPGTGQPCRPPGVPEGPLLGECRPGVAACVQGKWECRGAVGPTMEICDGKDNDCDGMIDNMAQCPETFACIEGECVPRCRNEEVARCPADRVCREGYCIRKACAKMPCPDGHYCDFEGKCVDPCANVKCPAAVTCERGVCQDCHVRAAQGEKCPEGQICGVHQCEPDLCHNVSCAADSYCRNGACVKECATVVCGTGQRCKDGACVPDLCHTTLCDPSTQYCDPADGSCKPNACLGLQCLAGTVCVQKEGKCVPSPCTSTRCNRNDRCVVLPDGTAECQRPSDQARVVSRLSPSGGGLATCACRLGGAAESKGQSAGLWLTILLGLTTLLRRSRRRHSGKI